MKKVLITGINGQDGSYLSELLLEKGCEVHGIIKRNSVTESQFSRIDPIREHLKLVYADITDLASLSHVIKDVRPDEIYNLAAQSHVRVSFDQPVLTAQVTGIGTLNVLEAARLYAPDAKIYQASSSEMFGNSVEPDGFQRETTRMNPASPYACSKGLAERARAARNENSFSFQIFHCFHLSYGVGSSCISAIISLHGTGTNPAAARNLFEFRLRSITSSSDGSISICRSNCSFIILSRSNLLIGSLEI